MHATAWAEGILAGFTSVVADLLAATHARGKRLHQNAVYTAWSQLAGIPR